MLPLEAHKKDQKKYLFPKPRHASKNFNLHNLNERLFETNMKSKLTVAKYKLLEMFFLSPTLLELNISLSCQAEFFNSDNRTSFLVPQSLSSVEIWYSYQLNNEDYTNVGTAGDRC